MSALPTDAAPGGLSREREQRLAPFAAAAAGGGAILGIVGSTIQQRAAEAPAVSVLQALTPAFQGQSEADVSPRTAALQAVVDNSSGYIAGSILRAVSTLLIIFVLLYLYDAVRLRRPELPGALRWALIAAAVVLTVVYVVQPFLVVQGAQDYLDGTLRTREAAEDAFRGGALNIVTYLSLPGTLALALLYVFISIQGMRVGLLTRFMGILGVIIGLFLVLPVLQPAILQLFWLGALALMFIDKWPGGTPPAWAAGTAIPWPSGAEQRAQRMAQQEERRKQRAIAKGEPYEEPASSGGGDDPSSALSEDAADAAPAPNRPTHTSRKRRKR